MEFIRLYKTLSGIFAYYQDRYYKMEQDWDALVNSPELFNSLRTALGSLSPDTGAERSYPQRPAAAHRHTGDLGGRRYLFP